MFASAAAVALAAAAPLGPVTIAEHSVACAGKDGWSDPAPPVHVFSNIYDVGTCGIVVLLVTSPRGHILIDGTTAEAVPGIAANIARLGFRLPDVKLILSTHEHVDHAGGIAALQKITGASLRLSPASTKVLSTGKLDPSDPQYGTLAEALPARPGTRLHDGETVAVGPLRLTAHFTPGHSPGGTSWAWRSCAANNCVRVVYADSMSAVSASAYRFSDHPERIALLRATFATVAALPCDLLITPHPAVSNFYDRLIGKAALIDPQACRDYAAKAREALAARLTRETAK